MKKVVTRVSKVFLVMAVAFSAFFTSGVANVFAASSTKKMAHLVSGANDANGHFGSVKPEAFVLSDKKDITNENFSFQLKLESEKADTRLRFVTKYVDDTHRVMLHMMAQLDGFMNLKMVINQDIRV